MKRASDIGDDSLMSSPMLQSALLGGLGYLGSRYLYDKFSDNKWKQQYISSIKDPEERMQAMKKLQEQAEQRKKWIGTLSGITLAAAPLIMNYDTIGKGWREGAKAWGGATTGEKVIGGVSGALASAAGGRETADNIEALNRPHPMDKVFSEKSYIYDNSEMDKEASSYNDAFSGLDFQMPYVRPLYTNGFKDIPVASSMKLMSAPNNVAAAGPELINGINTALHDASGGIGAGLISTKDLTKSLTRVGFGYMAGERIGSVLGTLLAQPPQVKEKLNKTTAIIGAVLNSGVIQ